MDTLYNYPLELVNSLKHTKPDQQNIDCVPSVTCDQPESMQTDDKTVTQSNCNNDSANSKEQMHTSATGSQENLSAEGSVNEQSDKTVDQSKTNTETSSKEENEVKNSGNKSTRADRWSKKKVRTHKDRAEAKLIRAKEIEEARKIIQQKNVDWYAKIRFDSFILIMGHSVF
jgi:hypothetical protein